MCRVRCWNDLDKSLERALATETELLRLALAAYEAAAEPNLWLDFLKRYAETVSAVASFLQTHDFATNTSTIHSSFGLSSPLKQSYNDYYSKLNIWRDQGRALFVPGRVNLDHEHCSRSLLLSSEFYNDCLKPFRVVYCFTSVIAREGQRPSTLTSMRSPAQRPFDETEREIARFLLPHVSRAWIIHQNLQNLAAGESALDKLPMGVVFLTPRGTAVYCNRAAEEIFAANDGLALRGGAIVAADRTARAQLRKTIDSALSPHASPVPGAVSVPRPSWRRAYQLAAAPLLTRFSQFVGMSAPAAVVLITDPERHEPAKVDLLIQTFKLTRKEAVLASKLFDGMSLKQAASELSISYETARTHLRRIFNKTETSRQAELLLLMARLPAIKDGDTRG